VYSSGHLRQTTRSGNVHARTPSGPEKPIMFDVLFEGRPWVYLLLVLILVFLLLLWRQRQHRGYLKAMAVVIAVGGLYFLLDLLHETDREAAERTLMELTETLNLKQYDKATDYLAEDFKYLWFDKKTIRPWFEGEIRSYDVKNLRAKRISVEKQDRDKRTITLRFDAKVDSTLPYNMIPCEVDFERDPQGRWKIKTFRLYNVVNSAEEFNPFQR
jgi:hypothetical protein